MAHQLFVPKYRIDECLDEIRECFEKGWTGLGFKTIQFEEAWKVYTGFNNAHFISSNTVGLHLALHIFASELGWDEGDEVITSPITFVATNHAIKYCNLSPVFVDVDEQLCMSPKSLEENISSKTRAVIFVGIGGNAGQYERVVEICKQRGLILILDAAHMAGTTKNGAQVGGDADCCVFSFQAVKNLPTADSGMICFKSAERDTRARKLSWLGINKDTFARTQQLGSYKWQYDVEEVGYKYHGNSIMAAIGLVSLRYLDADNHYRRQLAEWYTELLKNCKKIDIIEHSTECLSSRHLFQVLVNRRDGVLDYLNKNDIYPGVHYRINTDYALYEYASGTCINAEHLSTKILSLPLHLNMSHSDVIYICNKIKEALIACDD